MPLTHDPLSLFAVREVRYRSLLVDSVLQRLLAACDAPMLTNVQGIQCHND